MHANPSPRIVASASCGKPDVSTAIQTEGVRAIPAVRWRIFPAVGRTIWALGITSFLTDISSEMVASVLPMYLVVFLGISPLAFGFVDGLYQGAAALVRIIGGVLSDRWRSHKGIAVAGYALSAACRLLFLAAGNVWGAIAGVIALERIGKGIRTAPRDALIAQSSPTGQLATAFGVHRAMDAGGAMLGPVVAFALLALLPGNFDVVFVASFGIGILGVAAIILFVPTPAAGAATNLQAIKKLQLGSFLRCRNCPSPGVHCDKPASFREALLLLADPQFRALVIIGLGLGIATISDGFIFLMLQRRMEVTMSAFPLLYVGTSLCTSLLAIPCGRLADQFGRARIFVAGYGILALVYTLLLLPGLHGWLMLSGVVLLLGLYYAATDGVLTAMAAAVLPHSKAASGLAVLATGTNLARMAASVIFGLIWTRGGINLATGWYLGLLVLAAASAMIVLRRLPQRTSEPTTGRIASG